MDTKTGEIYEDYDEAVEDLKAQGATDEETMRRLYSITHDEYNMLYGMNRAQRRKWLKKNRKKKEAGG